MIAIQEDVSYKILTKEVVEPFKQRLLSWYREEASVYDEMPNLYGVLNDENLYSDLFYEAFVESICWTRYHAGVGYNPSSEDFATETYELAMTELIDCFEVYYPKIQHDVMQMLNSMGLSFSHQNYHIEPYEEEYFNAPLQEVW